MRGVLPAIIAVLLAVPGAAAAASATAEGNRAATRAEVHRLTASAQLPASRTSLDTAPAPLRDYHPALPSRGLVERASYYRVSLGIDDAAAFVKAHPPRGLTLLARGTSRAHGAVTEFDFLYSARDSAAWSDATLDIVVAADGAESTFWLVDASAYWRDPAPARDRVSGKRLRVRAKAACPAGDRGVVGVTNDFTLAGHRLSRVATPLRALLCRYSGPNGRAFTLRAQRRLGPISAAHLDRLVERVRIDQTQVPHSSCPPSDGSAVLVAFGYAHGPAADLWLPLGGCPYVSNGTIASRNADGSVLRFVRSELARP